MRGLYTSKGIFTMVGNKKCDEIKGSNNGTCKYVVCHLALKGRERNESEMI